ncbi:MAG: hypothetical protein Ta2D_02170 [Rickettsiales bacterium]|nr:MAG: hypothetical protein Ta2D_02170 [Rickettsiales bacterium]
MDISSSIAISVIVATLGYYFTKRLELNEIYIEQKFRAESEKRLREESEKRLREYNEKIRQENETTEVKIREESKTKETKIREEMWKKQDESRIRERNFIEESNTREFLVNCIRDESIPMVSRIEAAREYLEKGYNGSTKSYIYQKGLFDNSKK